MMWQALHICIMVIFCHSSQSLSGWMGTNHAWTNIFRFLQRCSIGFKPRLCLGYSSTFTELSQGFSSFLGTVLLLLLLLFIYLFIFYIETFSVNPSDPHESVAKSARWNLLRSLEIPDCMNSQLLDIFCVNLPINNLTEH